MFSTLRCAIAIIAIATMLPGGCFAQQPISAQNSYDYIQKQRVDAEILWRNKDQRGIDILNKLLGYLAEPSIHDFAMGFFNLKTRSHDIHYDLARAYALRGDKQLALLQMQQIAEEGGVYDYLNTIPKEPAFDTIREEPSFKQVLTNLAAQKRLWTNAAFKSPYKENLSPEEKVAGLSELWAEVKFNFANFDLAPDVDWDGTYRSYLTKVMATRSTSEYYRTLQEMVALLRDAHTSVDPPAELIYEFYSRPPLVTGLVEDKVLILQVSSPTVEALGLHAGQEVLAIDGVPVKEYATTRVAPYGSNSTQQEKTLRSYTYNLLDGPKNQPVTLTLKDLQGRTFEQSLQRSGYKDIAPWKRFEFKTLAGNIGYVAINDVGDKSINQAFEAKFDEIVQTSALIIDLRKNGGGSGGVAYRILATLTDKPFDIFQVRTKEYIAFYRSANGNGPTWYTQPGVSSIQWPADGKHLYKKPVVVLTGAGTGSSAEDFCVAFDYMKRGTIVGEPTGGSSGQPFYFELPGGGSARVCTIRDRYPDGREFIGIGIQPNILVHPTIAGVRAGKDEILETAIERLRQTVP